MFGELEDAEDTQDADEREAAAAFGTFAVSFRLLDDEYDKVREDRQQINDVHCVETEIPLRRTRRKPSQELAGKPSYARLITPQNNFKALHPLHLASKPVHVTHSLVKSSLNDFSV